MTRVAIVLGLMLFAGFASGSEQGEQSVQLLQGEGRELTVARCVICHNVDYIEMVAPVMNRTLWEKTVRKMIDTFGAPVSEEEARQILDYLNEHYSGQRP